MGIFFATVSTDNHSLSFCSALTWYDFPCSTHTHSHIHTHPLHFLSSSKHRLCRDWGNRKEGGKAWCIKVSSHTQQTPVVSMHLSCSAANTHHHCYRGFQCSTKLLDTVPGIQGNSDCVSLPRAASIPISPKQSSRARSERCCLSQRCQAWKYFLTMLPQQAWSNGLWR